MVRLAEAYFQRQPAPVCPPHAFAKFFLLARILWLSFRNKRTVSADRKLFLWTAVPKGICRQFVPDQKRQQQGRRMSIVLEVHCSGGTGLAT